VNKKLVSFAIFVLIFSWCVEGRTQSKADAELKSDLAKRRAAVASKIGDKAMLIVFSAPERPKTGDVSYEYRQSNNLYYLTGITQSETTFVMMPGNATRKEIIFAKDRDPAAETWTGKILSKEEVQEISGVQTVFSSTEFETFMETILNLRPYAVSRYVLTQEYDKFFDALRNSQANIYLVFEGETLSGPKTEEAEFSGRIRDRFSGFAVRNAWPILTELRQVKSAYEIKMLKEAIDITGDGLLLAIKTAKPGAWEYEIEAVLEETYKRRNAFDWGFPSIIASGPNATTLHYESSQRQMQSGDLLLMDVGAEFNFYTADITRTIPVNGKFTPEQADVYNIVLQAQEAAMKAIKPGVVLPDVHKAGTEVVKEGLKKLGLITDTTGDQYKIWFMHGVSHWLGMDVHDTGDRSRPLEPGMAFTVEPGIYIREDALNNLPQNPENEKFKAAVKSAFEKYKNIGIRIEDDVLVTATGYEHLSKKAPRTITDVENAMRK
jgi:Xaa-Pro aminopeptidase